MKNHNNSRHAEEKEREKRLLMRHKNVIKTSIRDTRAQGRENEREKKKKKRHSTLDIRLRVSFTGSKKKKKKEGERGC